MSINKTKNLIYETKNFWVLKIKSGFEVYKTGIVYSIRCTQIGWQGEKGKQKAIIEANRRQALYLSSGDSKS